MGKQGPCYHCGAKETPLWRNGPPGKPVLCNACGSRWRIRGTLENYVPKRGHGGGYRKVRKMSEVILDLNVEPATPSHRTESATGRNSLTSCVLNPNRASESGVFALNRMSSESATFDPQKIFKFGIKSENEDDDGITYSGKDEEPWEADDDEEVPSASDPFAHIKSLHKELLKLYNEEKSSRGNEEEEVLVDNVNPFMYKNEIGLGGFLLKPPLPIAPMEEAALKASSSSSSSSSSLTNQLDAKEEYPPPDGAGIVDKRQNPAHSLADINKLRDDQEAPAADESIEEMFFSRASFASDRHY